MYVRRLPGVLLLSLLVIAAAARAEERFGGIGISLAQLYDSDGPNHRGALVVLHAMEGLPAEAAGLRGGDVITHVDGEETAGREFGKLVLEELRGPVGSMLKLTVKRHGTGESLELEIERVEMTHAAPSSEPGR